MASENINLRKRIPPYELVSEDDDFADAGFKAVVFQRENGSYFVRDTNGSEIDLENASFCISCRTWAEKGELMCCSNHPEYSTHPDSICFAEHFGCDGEMLAQEKLILSLRQRVASVIKREWEKYLSEEENKEAILNAKVYFSVFIPMALAFTTLLLASLAAENNYLLLISLAVLIVLRYLTSLKYLDEQDKISQGIKHSV